MLYREIIAACSDIQTKHLKTLYGEDVELSNVRGCGTYIYPWDLKGHYS